MPQSSKSYATRAATASANYDKACWRDDFGYYYAVVDKSDCQNSYGPGCFVDQLCCAGLSAAVGFGYVFNVRACYVRACCTAGLASS